MALTAAQLVQCRQDFLRELRELSGDVPCNHGKPALNAAAAAVDTWCTSNQASFVAALPEPFKSGSSAGEKALLLAIVALRRYGL